MFLVAVASVSLAFFLLRVLLWSSAAMSSSSSSSTTLMLCVMEAVRPVLSSLPRHEGLLAGNGTAKDEGVDVVRALVGVDGLEVHDVADDVVFVADAVAAQHVAALPGNVQRLSAVVALHHGDHLRCSLARFHVLEPAETEAGV